jgi:hypothetical protein
VSAAGVSSTRVSSVVVSSTTVSSVFPPAHEVSANALANMIMKKFFI